MGTNTSLEIIRSSLAVSREEDSHNPVDERELKHLQRIFDLTNNPVYYETIREQWRAQRRKRERGFRLDPVIHDRLSKHGFNCPVSSKVVEEFPYAATVVGSRRSAEGLYIGVSGGREAGAHGYFSTATPVVPLNYTGDIPEWALDRLELAQRFHLFSVVTIHSCEPLPVTTMEMRPIDPVLIGWPHAVCIRALWSADRTQHVKIHDWNEHSGYIIAIWDGDKELCL